MGKLKVYTCNNFRGHWPVGTAAVIVAEHFVQARSRLYNQLKMLGFEPTHKESEEWRFVEIDVETVAAHILNDGNY